MQIFKINKSLQAVCEWKKTRMAFKHEATLLRDGQEIAFAKICYLNRTWESFEFESVLFSLLEKAEKAKRLEKREAAAFRRMIKNGGQAEARRVNGMFKSVAMVAKMGEILAPDQKSQNDWKARMLKAGLGNAGLIMPADWEQLSEDEKQRRLDAVIAELGKDQSNA